MYNGSSDLYVPASAMDSYKNTDPWMFYNIFPIYDNGYKELNEFFDMLLLGETASSNMQNVFNECVSVLGECASEEQAHLAFLSTCQPKLINAWAAEKMAQVEAAKKGVSNDYVNEVYAEVMDEIDAAVMRENIGAIRQAVTSGIAAVTSARILYKHLGQGIVPAPLGAGMRMRVTTKSDKVYEFKTSDLKSTEYYRATE